MKRLLTVSAILGYMLFHVNAQIIQVPGDQPSIQAGIDAASDGDTVLVANNTYYENINFKGKAITVASHFLLDGDTGHISRTIIDGSQPDHPDSASVVRMVSGEDTTSVLYGFTITRGSGTYYLYEDYNGEGDDTIDIGGGGIFILHSGGKIEHNIIKDNSLLPNRDVFYADGTGICAWVDENQLAIIRHNVVRNNSYSGNYHGSGGILITVCGKIIIDANMILDNTASSILGAMGGGGIYLFNLSTNGSVPVAIIRNNIIAGNDIYTGVDGCCWPLGAGIKLYGYLPAQDNQVYNNLIYNNHAHEGWGGGITVREIDQALIFNNTIVNNKAELGGEQLDLRRGAEAIVFNNILWSDEDNSVSEVNVNPNQNNVLIAMYNNIKGGWEGEGNVSYDPIFSGDSFELSDSSLCIGSGVDSIEIEGIWYYAPMFDFYRGIRPYPSGSHPDLGAIESEWDLPVNIQEILDIQDNIKIYPNPANSLLTIETAASGPYIIEIISLNGRLLYSKEMKDAIHNIELSSFQNGVYFITIRSKDLVTTRKIFKL